MLRVPSAQALLAFAALAGCDVTRVYAPAGSTGGGGNGGAPTTSGDTACEADGQHVCIAPVPEGWQGPFVLHQAPGGSSLPVCLGAYDALIGDYGSELDPSELDCGCSCGPATGIVCSDPGQYCLVNNCAETCFGKPLVTVPQMACTDITWSSLFAQAVFPEPDSPGSSAAATTPTPASPAFLTEWRACAGAQPVAAGCNGDQLCAPSAPSGFDAICILHSGEVACESPSYPTRHVVHEAFDDTRQCSQCTCGPADSSCGGAIQFTFNDCAFSAGEADDCGKMLTDAPPPVTEARYVPEPQGTCEPQGGVVSGAITEIGTATFCCR
jgi:hypothetical protein